MSAGDLRAEFAATVAEFEPTSPDTAAARAETLRFTAETADPASRTTRAGHLTSSGIILTPDGQEVLLTLHRALRLWLQTGGHCEPAETLFDAALREAREESGLTLLHGRPQPVDIDVHVVPCGDRSLRHFDVRFAVVYKGDRAAVAMSNESVALGWFPVDALPANVPEGTRRGVLAARRAVAG